MDRRILVILAVLGIGFVVLVGARIVPLAMPGTRNVNDHGTVTVHSLYGGANGGLGPAISSGDTLNAEDCLAVVWRPVSDYSGELTCQLYSITGTWYENGNWNLNTHTDPYFHLWGFILDGIPKGTTGFYCAFGGQYTEDVSWVGSTVYFSIESTAEPTYDPVKFTVEPKSASVAGGKIVTLRWWFISEGPATGVIAVDGVEASPRGITPSSSAQPFTHSFVSNVAGTYTVELTITPESGTAVSSSCEVTVTSTVTDTTTTTTGGNGDEDEFPFFYIVIVIIVIVGVVIVVKVVR